MKSSNTNIFFLYPAVSSVYIVTVNGTELIINSVSILDWTEIPAGSVDVN